MLRILFLAIGAFFSVCMVSCSGDDVAGGTIDPSTIALGESSSGNADVKEMSSSSCENCNINIRPNYDESSSSQRADAGSSSSGGDERNTPIQESSSSAMEQSDVIVTARNFSLECSVDVIYVDLAEIPASETPSVSKDVLAPYASKSIAADSVNIMISDYFAIPCGESEAEAFVKQTNEPGNASFGLAGDTLYVDVTRSKSMTYGCACVAQVKFTLDANNSGIQYTVFEQTEAIPLEEFE